MYVEIIANVRHYSCIKRLNWSIANPGQSSLITTLQIFKVKKERLDSVVSYSFNINLIFSWLGCFFIELM